MVFNGVILGLICMDLLEGMEADLSLLEKFKKKNMEEKFGGRIFLP